MSLKLFLKSEICLIIGISSTTLSLSLVVVVLYHNYDIYRYIHVWAISFGAIFVRYKNSSSVYYHVYPKGMGKGISLPGTKSWSHPLSGFSFKLHTSTSTVKPCSCITNFDRLILLIVPISSCS